MLLIKLYSACRGMYIGQYFSSHRYVQVEQELQYKTRSPEPKKWKEGNTFEHIGTGEKQNNYGAGTKLKS